MNREMPNLDNKGKGPETAEEQVDMSLLINEQEALEKELSVTTDKSQRKDIKMSLKRVKEKIGTAIDEGKYIQEEDDSEAIKPDFTQNPEKPKKDNEASTVNVETIEETESPNTSKNSADFLVNNIPPSDKSVGDITGNEKLEKPDFSPEKEDKPEDASGTEFETSEGVILGSKKPAKSPNEILRNEGVETAPGSKGYKPGESPIEDELNKPITPEKGKKLPEGQIQTTLGDVFAPDQERERLTKKIKERGSIKEPTGEKPAAETPEQELERELSKELEEGIREQLAKIPPEKKLGYLLDVIRKAKNLEPDQPITLFEILSDVREGKLQMPDDLLNPKLVPWPEEPKGEKAGEGKAEGGAGSEKPEGEKEGEGKPDKKEGEKTPTKTGEKPAAETPKTNTRTKEISLSDVWADAERASADWAEWITTGVDEKVERFQNAPASKTVDGRREYFFNARKQTDLYIKHLIDLKKQASRKGNKAEVRRLRQEIKKAQKTFREFTKGAYQEGLVKNRWLINPFRGRTNWWLRGRRNIPTTEERLGAQLDRELAQSLNQPENLVMSPTTFIARGFRDHGEKFANIYFRDYASTSLGMPDANTAPLDEVAKKSDQIIEQTAEAKAAAQGAGAPKGPDQTPKITA